MSPTISPTWEPTFEPTQDETTRTIQDLKAKIKDRLQRLNLARNKALLEGVLPKEMQIKRHHHAAKHDRRDDSGTTTTTTTTITTGSSLLADGKAKGGEPKLARLEVLSIGVGMQQVCSSTVLVLRVHH
jgi:hypothetical protein